MLVRNMSPLASHVLLALAVTAMGATAGRLASLAVPRGLGRAVAAAVLGGALVVAQALLLGLVALGGSAIALTAAACLSWVLARATLPAPETTFGDDLARAWERLARPGRCVAAALAGVAAVWTLWLFRYPGVGVDGSFYHLPEALAWMRNGRPGSVTTLFYSLPVGNYPVTDEVLRAWGTAIGESFVWSTIMGPAAALLILAAGWLGLRSLSIDRATAALALLALATTPVLVAELNSTSTDVTALAWLACCAALSALAVVERSERTLTVAIVAAGLAVGTKTTTAPLAAITLGVAVWVLAGRVSPRQALAARRARSGSPGARPASAGTLAVAVLVGSLAALVVGGLWYVRNLIEHGSPLWPFVAAPWGTPTPPVYQALGPSLLDRPRETLEGNLDGYARLLGGAALLLVTAPLSALLARRRTVLAAALVALIALLTWANAPVTGRGDIPGPWTALAFSATRYLLPVIAAAALAIALAARDGGRVGGSLALGLLVVSVAWSVARDMALGFPALPSLATLAIGVLLGLASLAAVELGARARLRRPGPRRTRPPAAWAALAIGIAALLASSLASGFVQRHGRTGKVFDAGVASWFSSQPGFATGSEPIAFAPSNVAPLAGDRLTHPLELIPVDEPCERVRGRLREGYVVLVRYGESSLLPTRPPVRFPTYGTAPACLRPLRPAYAAGGFRVYAPRHPAFSRPGRSG